MPPGSGRRPRHARSAAKIRIPHQRGTDCELESPGQDDSLSNFSFSAAKFPRFQNPDFWDRLYLKVNRSPRLVPLRGGVLFDQAVHFVFVELGPGDFLRLRSQQTAKRSGELHLKLIPVYGAEP